MMLYRSSIFRDFFRFTFVMFYIVSHVKLYSTRTIKLASILKKIKNKIKKINNIQLKYELIYVNFVLKNNYIT